VGLLHLGCWISMIKQRAARIAYALFTEDSRLLANLFVGILQYLNCEMSGQLPMES